MEIGADSTHSGHPTVSVVVLAYLADPWLRNCVEAVLASEKVIADVVLVDNGCTSDDVGILERLDGVTVVRPGRNLGFAGGCNVGAEQAKGEFIALVNGDAIVEPTTLARLVEEVNQPGIGIAGASIRLSSDPSLVNSAGNPVHVLGLSWSGGFNKPEQYAEPVEVAVASGACMVLSRTLWRQLDGFDEEYFAYHEDTELSMRVWRLGMRVMYVPDAIAVHRYEFSRNTFKFYMIERNRLMFLATLWGWRALVLLSPALVMLEVAMVLLAAKQGWLKAKLRGWWWLLGHLGHIRRRRSLLQGELAVSHRQWMHVLTDQVDVTAIQLPGIVGMLNAMTSAYWRLVSRLV